MKTKLWRRKMKLNKMMPALALAAAVALPAIAQARPVTFTANLKNYGGSGAYVAIYLTDAKGVYKGTLWMAGPGTSYYHYLHNWERASGGNLADINGLTGASIGAGQTLSVTLDLSDALINAGYQIRLDAAVRHMPSSKPEVVVRFRPGGKGKPVKGRRYIQSFQYDM